MSAILKQKLIDIANGFTKYGLWKGGGSSNLSELDDVTLTNLQTNDVLTYNGSEWVNDDNLQTQINTLNSNLNGLVKTKNISITTNAQGLFALDLHKECTVISVYELNGYGYVIIPYQYNDYYYAVAEEPTMNGLVLVKNKSITVNVRYI